ncbi:carbonic anhydrase family protein [Allostreptomyces psammosilenae]|uniref:Carbonic anhydrase n=1 Tax=Allostreptomyces psammosilenae TaxID=1892865 RepID=A0A853A0Q1_9ACTN|nr:carbonic anhydrase family protein [Allostreptomyces psammosilenae]NYI08193.1 carbonic anhydrase [Allostreptomyces psammosilenae]
MTPQTTPQPRTRVTPRDVFGRAGHPHGDRRTLQSPVDIPTDRAIPTRLPVLTFHHPPAAHTTLTLRYERPGSHQPSCQHPDRETTIGAEVAPQGARLDVGGVRHTFAGVHWHTPAEHLLNGTRFPLEQHAKYVADDGTRLVVAVLFREGEANPLLERLFRALPQPGAEAELREVDLAALFPATLGSYRYTGSLTTCPYTSPVHWIVLADPLTAADHQIELYRERFPDSNARPTQPLGPRHVRTDTK